MKKVRLRISALVGGSVLFTLLLVMAGFNIIINRKMQLEADHSIRNMIFSGETDDSSPSLYFPEMILIPEDTDAGDQDKQFLFTAKERSIIGWCGEHDASSTSRVQINGNTYYVLCAETENMDPDMLIQDFSTICYSFSTDESDSFAVSGFGLIDDELAAITESFISTDIGNIKQIIAYIDITGELDMIRQINLVFLITSLIVGALGSTIGYFIGKRLEQNQLAQKQFFENTSHELKTPLTSIRGYAEGIETGVITDYVKTGRVISAQTSKMSALIEEILCMAKLESGSVTLEREPVELSAFLQDCMMPFEGAILTKQIKANLSLEEITVSADPDKLEHAVSNLITNAVRYARSYISVSCKDNIIRIENDCEPISDDTLRHLFDRFYTGRDGNTGIGLSIARELISLHGWKLTAERTENGIGFCIHITGR